MESDNENIENEHFKIFSNDKTLPSYQQFYHNVMLKNICCLFGSQLTKDWICRKEWLMFDHSTTINFDYLSQKYGSLIAPVYNCNQKYFNSNPKSEMKFDDYLEYWKRIINCGHRYDNETNQILYLKDWHLAQDSQDSSFYQVPIYFESDYLNEYCLSKQLTDFRFTYMGPTGSSTPLHTDVFGSYSWSANVIGEKKWLMIPSSNVPLLKQLVCRNGECLPSDLYSLSDHLNIFKQVGAFEITQKSGEVVFVPSGFMHQVQNTKDTISVNHNWFNACNLELIYQNLLEAFQEVQQEISDLKTSGIEDDEFYETCQKILTIHFGMNFDYFFEMIRCIAENRLKNSCTKQPHPFKYEHDIESIRKVLNLILSNKIFLKNISQNDRKFLDNFCKFC